MPTQRARDNRHAGSVILFTTDGRRPTTTMAFERDISSNEGTMDMIDHRSRYALVLAHDRISDLHREADRQRLLKGVRRQSEPRHRSRWPWSIADLVSPLMPGREVASPNATADPEPL
jgi:hypothetical protein